MGLQVEIQKLLDIISFLLIKLGKDHAESNITELNDILIKSRADILKIQSNISDVGDHKITDYQLATFCVVIEIDHGAILGIFSQLRLHC